MWNNTTPFSLKVTKGQGISGQDLSPNVGTIIESNSWYNYCLLDYIIIDIFSDSGGKGDYLGTASVSVKGSGDGRYLYDSNNLLVFSYDAAHSSYKGSDPWQWRRAQTVTAPGIANGPCVITNAGWLNGMGNQSSQVTAHQSFWARDYGDDPQRWVAKNQAIYQSTACINSNVGSRAFPIYLSTGSPTWIVKNCEPDSSCNCANTVAPGVAFEGCWQIEMSPGSNGAPPFCETFYLSERANLAPGVSNYQDGAGGAPGGNSREIDIMETRWQPAGPQANCQNAVGNGWNTDWANKLMGKWSDVGGLPLQGFVTFGCYIKNQTLWIYGYKQDGSQWYCSDPIPMNNTSYIQKNPFVPYIGTWAPSGTSGGSFETGYKNFVYLEVDNAKIKGFDPKNNPDHFGPALVDNKLAKL